MRPWRWLWIKWFGWRASRRLRRGGIVAIYCENLRLMAEGKPPNQAW